MSSSRYVSSNSIPDSWAANLASAAFFYLTSKKNTKQTKRPQNQNWYFRIALLLFALDTSIYLADKSCTAGSFRNTNACQPSFLLRQWKVAKGKWVNIQLHCNNNNNNEISALSFRQSKATYSLCFTFISSLILMIDSTEIRYDDRNGQSNDKHCNGYNFVRSKILITSFTNNYIIRRCYVNKM